MPSTLVECHRVLVDDGVELHTVIVRPDVPRPVPAVYHATPYSADAQLDEARSHAATGIAIVTQEVRGRFASGGLFDLGRSAGRDGAVTVAWLRDRSWCDGQVVGRGTSFGGYTQLAAAAEAPDLFDSVAPVMAPDPWRGLSFRGVGGAVRLGLLTHWLIRQAAGDPAASPDLARTLLGEAFEHFQVLSAYDGHAGVNPDLAAAHPTVGRLPQDPSPALSALPVWADLWREAWAPPVPARAPVDLDIPVAIVVGFYDLFVRDAVRTFHHSPHPDSRLVLVPTGHGFHLLQYPVPSHGHRYGLGVDHLWARERLLGEDHGLAAASRVTYWMFGADEWRGSETWPPPEAGEIIWHLRAGSDRTGGALARTAPDGATTVTLEIDPRSPYPTPGGATLGFPPGPVPVPGLGAGARVDVATFSTDPFEVPVDLVGLIQAQIWIGSDAPDVDVAAVLVVVASDGTPLAIASGLTRARYRSGVGSVIHPTENGLREPVRIGVDLGHLAWRMPAGCRLRLDLTGSDFPRHDRNLHTGGPEGLEPLEAARVATVDIHTGPDHPSTLSWSVLVP